MDIVVKVSSHSENNTAQFRAMFGQSIEYRTARRRLYRSIAAIADVFPRVAPPTIPLRHLSDVATWRIKDM